MRKWVAVIFAVLLVSVATTALAEGPQDSWKITGPANGANVTGPDVTVTVDSGQIKVVKPGGPVTAGEGHWHFFVDGTEVGKGPVHSFTFQGLTPGKHELKVELHNNDHTPYPGDTGRIIAVNVALPNTGANVYVLALSGALLVGAGAVLLRRRRTNAA